MIRNFKCKAFLFAIFAICCFISCEKDEPVALGSKEIKLTKTELITFDQLAQEAPKVMRTIENTALDLEEKAAGLQKNASDAGMDIDPSRILKTSHVSGYVSYTISIKSDPEDRILSNILVEQFPNGTEKVSHVEYRVSEDLGKIDPESLGSYINGTRLTPMEGFDTDFLAKSGDDQICIDIVVVSAPVYCSFIGTKDFDEHPGCFDDYRNPKPISTTTVVEIKCFDRGGGPISPNPGDPINWDPADGDFYPVDPSNSNGSGGGATNNDGEQECTGTPGEQETFLHESGACVSGLSGAVIGEDLEPEDPQEKECDYLQDLLDDPVFKSRLNDLISSAQNDNFERIHEYTVDLNGDQLPFHEDSGTNNVPQVKKRILSNDILRIILIHTHYEGNTNNGGTISMFSYGDLTTFTSDVLTVNARGKDTSQMTSILVAANASSVNVYAIKKDPNSDIANNYGYHQSVSLGMTTAEIKEERDRYKDDIEDAKSQSALEIIALAQLKKMGLQLYKTTRVHTGWKQLTLDANSSNPEDPKLGTPKSCN